MDSELVSALRENGRRVLADQFTSQQLHRLLDQAGDCNDPALWTTAGELGWLGIAVPEDAGGLGAGIAEAAAMQEELGRSLATLPFLSTTIVARALAAWPHASMRERWLPAIAAGEAIGAVAIDLAGAAPPSATIADGGITLTGTCAAVLAGESADLVLLPVTMPDDTRALALIERGVAGAAEALPVADLTRNVARLRFDEAAIPAAQLVSGDAAAALIEQLADEARILVASDAIGGAEAILAATVDYLKTRIQFGKAIGTFQALKHRCADHKMALEAARRLVAKAMAEQGSAAGGRWAGMAKFAACDCYAALAADAVQLHGGIGFTWEHDAHLYLKRALFDAYLFGDSAALQDRTLDLLTAEARA